MRILRASDYKRMPWKNGGGETVEIAVSPEGAGLADFDWRVSMATVATDGPFSVFPGIDRTLSILEGAGMTLFIEGREPVLLTQSSDPLPFAADAPTSATLVDGAITDLNVMTRQGKLGHSVRHLGIDGHAELAPGSETTLVLCHRGYLDIDDRKLAVGDCLVFEAAAGARHSVSGTAQLFVVELRRI